MGKQHIYACKLCDRKAEVTMPEPPALGVFPVPKGWTFVTTPIDVDDALVCGECCRQIINTAEERMRA